MSRQTYARKLTIKDMVIGAVLIALGVVFSLPFPTGLMVRVGDFLKFSLSFIPVALAARKFGPIWSTLIAIMIDVFQALFSSLGPPNPLILVSNALIGLIFGFLLYNPTLKKLIIAIISSNILCTLIITTAALIWMYSYPLLPLLWWRLIQTVIMIILQFAILYFLLIKTNILHKIKFL